MCIIYTLYNYKHLFFPELDANEVLFRLQEHKFPADKWEKLATGLRLATATSTIEADKRNVEACLQALIIHWLANDREATWQKLVEAVEKSNEKVIAANLAKDVEASYPGRPSLPLSQYCNAR